MELGWRTFLFIYQGKLLFLFPSSLQLYSKAGENFRSLISPLLFKFFRTQNDITKKNIEKNRKNSYKRQNKNRLTIKKCIISFRHLHAYILTITTTNKQPNNTHIHTCTIKIMTITLCWFVCFRSATVNVF